jgi:hypothetical protein
MNKQQAQQIIRATFESPFNKSRFTAFIKNLLNRIDDTPFTYQGNYIPDAYKQYIKTLERIGKFSDGENTIDILVITLQKETSLERARTMQRNFGAWYLNGSRGGVMKDAALVAYVSPDQEDWRFSLVRMDYKFEQSKTGKMKVKQDFTPARRWSFLVGANEKSHTAQSRLVNILADDEQAPTLQEIENAFDIETVTKEFFLKYRDLFIRTKEELDKVVNKDPKVRADFENKGVDTVNFAKKLLGQIVFLYFLQKKGWFGVGRDDAWGTGSKHFLRELFEKKHSGYRNFFNDILEPLFYEALRFDRSYDDDYYSRFNCKIPFLNGGLFDPIGNYDWVHTDIPLPDSLFSNTNMAKEGDIGDGILDIFDRYNFTVKEDEPLEKEVAIDPELLGKAYEKFNAIRPDNFEEYKKALKSGKKGDESKFNKQFGVYYTPREIVHYMCQQSLINYLHTELNDRIVTYEKLGDIRAGLFGNEGKTGQLDLTTEHSSKPRISKADIETFIDIGEHVSENEARVISEGRETRAYSHKLPETIRQNAALIDQKLANITVCDPAVGSGAFPVGMMNEIVRARNVLSTFMQDINRTPYEFKRRCIEHSLYGVDIDPGAVEIAKLRLWLSLVVDEDEIKNIKPLPNLDYKIVCGNSLLGYPYTPKGLEKIEKLKELFIKEVNPMRKNELRSQIDDTIYGLFKNTEKSLGYKVTMDFKINFSEVFHEKGGFDVVIANPPYNAELLAEERQLYKDKFDSVRTGRQDTAAIFVEIAKRIGNPQMQFSFILPYRLFSRKRNHGEFQLYTLKNFSLLKILYLGSDVGFSANDEFMILIMSSKVDSSNKIKVAFKPTLQKLWDNHIFSKIDQSILFEKGEVNLNIARFDVGLLKKINYGCLSLETICHVKDGIVPFIRDQMIKEKKIDARYVKFAGIAGHYQLLKYFFRCDDLWLCYDINEARKYIKDKIELRKVQLRERDIFLHRKILTAQNSAVLKGTIDENRLFVSNSLHSSYLRDEYEDKFHLEYILSLINSFVIDYYHNSLRQKGTDLHPQILVSDLKKLPIKDISRQEQKPFIEIVDKILAITKDDDYLKNPAKQAQVKEYEKQIDRMVYELYGLTEDEIKIVEGANENSD